MTPSGRPGPQGRPPRASSVPSLRRRPSFVSDLTKVLAESLEDFGERAQERYAALLKQVLEDLAADPKRLGVREVEGRPEIFAYHIRHSRGALPSGMRVRHPRHVVIFRIVDDGRCVLLLRLLHDAMLPEPRIPGA